MRLGEKGRIQTNKAWHHFCYEHAGPCLFVCAYECVSCQVVWQSLNTICAEWHYGYFNSLFMLETIILKELL